jgi:predicted secreted protein
VREDERRAVRRAAVTSVGVAVALTATTLVGVAVASMVGSRDVPARVGAAYRSPEDLPGCGTLGDLAAPAGIAVAAPAVAEPGTAVEVTVTSAVGEPPAPLAVLVVRGPEVVARDAGPGTGPSAVVVLTACGAGPAPGTASPTVATTAGRATPSAGGGPPLPPGDYRLVVLLGGDLPDRGRPTYEGPALTAVSRPLTVAAPGSPADVR